MGEEEQRAYGQPKSLQEPSASILLMNERNDIKILCMSRRRLMYVLVLVALTNVSFTQDAKRRRAGEDRRTLNATMDVIVQEHQELTRGIMLVRE